MSTVAHIENPELALLIDNLGAIERIALHIMGRRWSVGGVHRGLGVADVQAEVDARLAFVRELRSGELALLARLLQARRCAEMLPRLAADVRPLMRLFIAGTRMFVEDVAERDRATSVAMVQTGDAVTYLRSRGVLSSDQSAPEAFGEVVVDDLFLIGGLAPLGVILDLAMSFRQSLEHWSSLLSVPRARAEA